MDTIAVYVAITLIMVIEMAAIVIPNTIQADNITKYCIDGGPFCGEKKTDCRALLVNTTGDHKCLEVKIG